MTAFPYHKAWQYPMWYRVWVCVCAYVSVFTCVYVCVSVHCWFIVAFFCQVVLVAALPHVESCTLYLWMSWNRLLCSFQSKSHTPIKQEIWLLMHTQTHNYSLYRTPSMEPWAILWIFEANQIFKSSLHKFIKDIQTDFNWFSIGLIARSVFGGIS